MTESATCNVRRADLRLWTRSVREGWDVPEDQRAEIIAASVDALENGSTRHKLAAAELLLAMNAANQAIDADSPKVPASEAGNKQKP